ncbi:UNVERIFIED_CONTAM: hypothetical protein FKN15_008482 [Acipenser sinensis]
MAEAWIEEDEEELRDLRESGNRRNRRGHMNPATAPPLTVSQNRRPEIRILAVEPLGPGTWFPGGPGGCAGSAALGFPPPAHSQGLWGGSIPASAQPPPSYDQVIREITHEQVPTTATNAPPRPSAVTISTQTDFDEAAESSALGIDVNSQAAQSESVPAAVRRPLKPPRPSVLPSTIKPESPLISRESPLIPSEPLLDPSEHLLVPESSIVPSECPAVHTNTVSQPLFVPTESSAVPTESAAVPPESAVVPVEPVLVLEPAAKESVIIRQPVPRPRSMINLKPQAKEAQVEILVELKEDNDENSKVLPNSVEQSTTTHLQELLEAFYPEDQSYTDSMNTYGSQRNIHARIQAFESQSSTDISDAELSKRPEIPLRTLVQKPPVTACRPSLVPKPANRGSGEWDTLTESKPDLAVKNGPVFVLPKLQGTQVTFGGKPEPPKKPISNFMSEINRNDLEDESDYSIVNKLQNEKKKTPVPVPRPKLTKINSLLENTDLTEQAVVPAPRPSLSERAKAFGAPDEAPKVSRPTPPLQKANSGLDFNSFNNQTTPAVVPVPRPSISERAKAFGAPHEAPEVSRPTPPLQKANSGLDFNSFNNQTTPALLSWNSAENKSSEDIDLYFSKPEAANNVPNRQSMQRKPTMIRIDKPPTRSPNDADCQAPPPIPAYGPVGGFTGSKPKKPTIASRAARLKNEVLVLLQQIDSNSYECQGGDEKGKVLKSRMKIITPLNTDTGYIGPLKKSFSFGRLDGDGSGLRGRVLHDFAAEHPDELMLRAGDTVTQLEKVDAAWYHGTCRGRSGIFPVDFVEVDVPAATNGKKARPPPASISGPRCVARFDFEGEHADELTFFEGDVIKLKELVGEEWARGEMNGQTGIFPLNFVEIVEGLPPSSQQQLGHNKPSISDINQNSLGEIKQTSHFVTSFKARPEVARPNQWCEAFYDFAGQTNEDLSFFKGDRILITEKVDSDWYRGRLNGKEGIFPAIFVEGPAAFYDFAGQTNEDLSFFKGDRILITEKVDSDWYRGRLNGKEGIFPAIFVEGPAETVVGVNPQLGGSKKGKAKALFDFVSESEEELSFRTGDVITALESIDAEWFCGELHGKCGLFPKNYVQVLQEP